MQMGGGGLMAPQQGGGQPQEAPQQGAGNPMADLAGSTAEVANPTL